MASSDRLFQLRLLLAAAPFFFALSVPGHALARTYPVRGAVGKPLRFGIQTPFPCGVKVRVNCSYGPSCSPAHKRVTAPGATNDRYAVDMTRSAPLGGYDMPVVAVASGVVRIAGWAKRGWAPYGQLVYIEHAFKDRKGNSYFTLYAHLHRVLVQPGQNVQAGTVIGTLGGSSRRRYLRFGPHLHFAMYQGAKRSLGGGRAVVPEPMGVQEDISSRMEWTSCDQAQVQTVASVPARTGDRVLGGLMEPQDEPGVGRSGR